LTEKNLLSSWKKLSSNKIVCFLTFEGTNEDEDEDEDEDEIMI